MQARLGVERHTTSACGNPLASDLRDEIDGLRDMEPHYRVWGGYEGRGLVIRSEEPVEFHPDSERRSLSTRPRCPDQRGDGVAALRRVPVLRGQAHVDVLTGSVTRPVRDGQTKTDPNGGLTNGFRDRRSDPLHGLLLPSYPLRRSVTGAPTLEEPGTPARSRHPTAG